MKGSETRKTATAQVPAPQLEDDRGEPEAPVPTSSSISIALAPSLGGRLRDLLNIIEESEKLNLVSRDEIREMRKSLSSICDVSKTPKQAEIHHSRPMTASHKQCFKVGPAKKGWGESSSEPLPHSGDRVREILRRVRDGRIVKSSSRKAKNSVPKLPDSCDEDKCAICSKGYPP